MLPPNQVVVRFGRFDVDFRAGELRKDGRRVRLQEQPFRVLEALVERPGEVVTRDELRQRLWPGDTFVDFDNGLNNCVNKLRLALGDSAAAPRFVETVGRRGYRFIATLDADAVQADAGANPAGSPAATPEAGIPATPVEPPRTSRRWALPLTIASLIALFALVLGALAAALRAPTEPLVTSIAVLPLVSLSSDPEQEYFSDGMTDALITHLAGIRALRVISRQSTIRLKRTDKSMPEIGRELGVDAVIEGTVLRTDRRVRVTVQLLHAATDRHIWSQEYERDLADLLGLQSEIARTVAREIRIAVLPGEAARLEAVAAVAPAALDAYLRGRYLWLQRTESSLRRALEYFRQATALTPSFAAAHAAIAETYGPLGYLGFMAPDEAREGMKAAGLRAVELDPQLVEGWTALGACAAFHEWDWTAAERDFRRALETNPNYATTYMWYGLFLENMGRQEENLAMRRRAIVVDPLNPAAEAALGSALSHAGRLDEAIRQLQGVLELEPGFPQAQWYLGQAYVAAGRPEEAIRTFEAMGRSGSLGHAYGVAGREAEARAILRELEETSRTQYVSPYEPALVHVSLGEHDAALAWLERAFETRAVQLCQVKSDRRLAPLRGTARFRALLTRMQLAD
jgi:TolB-like protein/DNA-binding winged helix-turn-helix (wHTH) protein/Tfp pilus assembly protein PilF